MKKVLKTLALTGSMLAIAATAQAADTAQVTLTSPAITKQGCERVGSVTLTFDQGTVLTEGDWFYMDLPTNTSICNKIDYFIASGISSLAVPADTITYPSTNVLARTVNGNVSTVDLAGAAATIPALVAGATSGDTVDDGIFTNNIDNGAGAPTVVGGGGVVIRVYSPANGRRVWGYVYGNQAAAAGSLTVQNLATNNSTLSMRILDGKAYSDLENDGLINANGEIVLNNAGTVATPTIWGDDVTDQIGATAGAPNGTNIPHVENTLCVDASQMAGDLMFVSFNSLNNFLTFTGDSQIAHTASANSITLQACGGKTDFPTQGNILIGSQGGCLFDYEVTGVLATAPIGYCTYNAANTFIGNKMLIVGASTFGDPGDRYDMVITSDTNGVYWAGAAPVITGFTPSETTDTDCTTVLGGTVVPGLFSVNSGMSISATPGACSVTASNRVDTLSTGSVGNITGIDTYDTLWVNLPNLQYDTTIVGNGIEADVSIQLNKYPCGSIFNGTRTVGTFVTTCPVSTTGGTTLLYPFMVPFDGVSAGSWWGGFTIVNAGTAAGTCTLAMMEADGDTATYTTGSIAANGGQWNAGALTDLLAMVTPGATNAGTFGDSNVSVTATCTMNMAGGFAFIGNDYGVGEGTGYTAYVLDSVAIWQ